MKKNICVMIASVLLLSGCTQTSPNNPAISQASEATEKPMFKHTAPHTITSNTGEEYTFLAMEGQLYYLGELEFVGCIEGEPKISSHLSMDYKTGMYAISSASTNDILIRKAPDNEWFAIYRKSSLEPLDYSIEGCNRIELDKSNKISTSIAHSTCDGGLSDPNELAAFMSDVLSQKSPRESGLYDLIEKPDGRLENCYLYGELLGYFEEEPNLVLKLQIYSFNDLGYSVEIGEKEYILPEFWLQRFNETICGNP